MWQRMFLVFVFSLLFSGAGWAVDVAYVDKLVSAADIDVAAVKRQGPEVMPVLAAIYTEADDELKRAKIAWLFYQLGWQSEEAKEALMQDINTTNAELRLQVQWALGRVSNDDEVVSVLLNKMRNDTNPLFRDKAACALASDQIHLTEMQRFKLLQGLVEALNDEKLQVRQIAIKALEIQAGQRRGFVPSAALADRQAKIVVWQQWLAEYQKNL